MVTIICLVIVIFIIIDVFALFSANSKSGGVSDE